MIRKGLHLTTVAVLDRSSLHALFTAQRDSSRLLYRELGYIFSSINLYGNGKRSRTNLVQVRLAFSQTLFFSKIFVISRASLITLHVVEYLHFPEIEEKFILYILLLLKYYYYIKFAYMI